MRFVCSAPHSLARSLISDLWLIDHGRWRCGAELLPHLIGCVGQVHNSRTQQWQQWQPRNRCHSHFPQGANVEPPLPHSLPSVLPYIHNN